MSVNAKQYFQDNIDKAGLCLMTPVVEGRKVKVGDRITVTGWINVISRAEEDGWQVVFHQGGKYAFLNNDEFNACFKPFEIEAQDELPAGAKVIPVRKGQNIFVQPWDDTPMGVHTTADADGFVVTLPENGKARFMSQSSFRAAFKNAAAAPADQGFFKYVPQYDDLPTGYVVLEEPVTFDFKEGPYTAPAGSVLYKNDDDIDGYTVTSAESFALHFTILVPPRDPEAPARNTAPAPAPRP